MKRYLTRLILAAIACASSHGVMAADVSQTLEIIGKPTDRGLGFQPAVTELARDIVWFDTLLLYVIAAICAFVLGLIAYVILRYNRRVSRQAASFSHYTPVEIIWTVVPVVILLFISAVSLPILFKQQIIPEGDVNIKATGNQWYWSYEYPDHEFSFDSFMLSRDELEDYGYSQDEYLLATDTAMVVPVGQTVVVNVTASDVIHAWTIPAFGVKQDGVPGRLAGLWFKAETEGIFFGQCSELCGKDHAYMPITVKVVSQEAYDEWLDTAREEYAQSPGVKPSTDGGDSPTRSYAGIPAMAAPAQFASR